MILKTLWHLFNKVEDKKAEFSSCTASAKYKTSIEKRKSDFSVNGRLMEDKYVCYVEIARDKYLTQLLNLDFNKIEVALKTLKIDYLQPIHIDDKLSVYVRTNNIVGETLIIDFIFTKQCVEQEQICALITSTCFFVDHTTNLPLAFTSYHKEAVIKFEQLAL